MSWRVGRGEAGELGKGQVVKALLSLFQGLDFILKAMGAGEGSRVECVAEELQEERGEIAFVVWKCCSGACYVRWAGGERAGRPDAKGGGCHGHLGSQSVGNLN